MTDDQRRIVSAVLNALADTLPIWRDAAIGVLALVVIVCLLFWSVLYDG